MATHTPSAAPPTRTLAETPRGVRRLARLIIVAFPLLVVALVFVPWTQNAHGTGRAVAFNPVQRPQFVMATIEGRIFRWYVVEGQKVKAGERIVELLDNDPDLLRRLEEEETTIEGQALGVQGMMTAFEGQVTNQRLAQINALAVERQQVLVAQNAVDQASQAEVSANATFEAADMQLKRAQNLVKDGLESVRNVELAQQAYENTKAAASVAKIGVQNAKENLKRARENESLVRAATDAQIKALEANVERSRVDLKSVDRLRLGIQSRIERQRRQTIEAPTDGTIFRLLANGEAGGQLVRAGDRLAVLVPDIKAAEPLSTVKKLAAAAVAGPLLVGGVEVFTPGNYPGIVAEISIDGNDLPLVRIGDKVRLQFEGWPAVQFVGWPSSAVGTFGGRVYLIDPTAEDKNGLFRILVEPDPDEAEARRLGEKIPHIDTETGWPEADYLRQGVRVQGWVLFQNVPVWWEIFRQLNGFPPTRDPKAKLPGSAIGPVGKK